MLTELPDWVGLAPTLLLGLASLAVFAVDTIKPHSQDRLLLSGLSALGAALAAGVAAVLLVGGVEPTPIFGDQLVVDDTYLFFSVVFGAVTLLVSLASYDYLRDHAYQAEYYSLVLLAATGMSLMASANSLVTVFIAIELASLPSYALVGFLKSNRGSVEGATKYFLIGALSSAILIYGISLIYGATGVLQLDAVAEEIADPTSPGLLGIGILMVAGGIAFKTASVPFHFWAPEAYEGAPAPISAFISSASKAAGFAVAFRVFLVGFPVADVAGVIDWGLLFAILAVVTMVVGNFAAAVQENVKRMLAYSSVGHAGYALIGLAVFAEVGTNNPDDAILAFVLAAAMMHLLVYGFMNTGAFLFVGMAEYWGVGRRFEDYNGLAKQAPMASVAMAIFMFSLAGLPVAGGFLSKLALFAGAVWAGFWWLAAVGVVVSVLSLYYYARVVKAIWVEEPSGDLSLERQPAGLYAAVMVAALATVALLPAFGVGLEAAIEAAEALVGVA